MEQLNIKNVDIKTGEAKICVPIIAKKQKAIIELAKDIMHTHAGLVEWRCDYYEDYQDMEKVIETLDKLNNILLGKPLIFTFRTKLEGGQAALEEEKYQALYKAVIDSRKADLVDVEVSHGEKIIKQIVKDAKIADIKVILSHHDFYKTPTTEEIIQCLQQMEKDHADICKVAYMPKNEGDVQALMQASKKAKQLNLLFVAISMGSLGELTRRKANTLGSCITFGSLKDESAPGQIEVEKLYKALE